MSSMEFWMKAGRSKGGVDLSVSLQRPYIEGKEVECMENAARLLSEGLERSFPHFLEDEGSDFVPSKGHVERKEEEAVVEVIVEEKPKVTAKDIEKAIEEQIPQAPAKKTNENLCNDLIKKILNEFALASEAAKKMVALRDGEEDEDKKAQLHNRIHKAYIVPYLANLGMSDKTFMALSKDKLVELYGKLSKTNK